MTKYLTLSTNWHCKKRGGLFLGLHIEFPKTIFDTIYIYQTLSLTLGLLLFSIKLNINYNHIPEKSDVW